MPRSSSQMVLSLLVLLLGLQLSGLSCLGEWEGFSFSPVPHLRVQSGDVAPGEVAPGEDGCPCHLVLMAGPRGGYDAITPACPADLAFPHATPFLSALFPFHPPL